MRHIILHCDENLTEVALFEDHRLVEYFAERPENRPLIGNIYKGRIVNVLKGMQAAFIDIGLSKNAFLYVNDLLPAHLEKQPDPKPSIEQLIEEGQEIVVQIVKEPLGSKGAKVTTHYSIPGRSLVYMPYADYVAVSRKIDSEEEKQRLKEIGENIRQGEEGLIIRTVAEGESDQTLLRELKMLRNSWNMILKRAETTASPGLIYQDMDVVSRIVRDLLTGEEDEIVVDDPSTAEKLTSLLKETEPHFTARVKLYEGPPSIYEAFGVNTELDKLLRPKIWLNNGGYVVVDQTEALTVIDVNTGKYTGSTDLEDTVFETNLEAAELIPRLLRLRDIGGIIIIDFIDMDNEEHKRLVVERMEEALRHDRTRSHIVGWTRLGLLEMTRKKVRENIDRLFFDTCMYCGGAGKIKMK